MIEKIDGFEIYENKQSPRIINIDIGDEILNKLIFPFNKFDITALEYKPFTRFTIAKSLDDLSNNKLSKLGSNDSIKPININGNVKEFGIMKCFRSIKKIITKKTLSIISNNEVMLIP